MSRSRRLTDAEIEIWLKVAQTVRPRPGASTPSVAEAAAPAAAEPVPPVPAPPKMSRVPCRRFPTASYTPPVSAPGGLPLTGLERRFKKKVAGGRIDIDGALDLHGMTQAEAHGALLAFLLRTQAQGGRLVLVVTGKGGPRRRDGTDGGAPGVLRRAVPHWLRDMRLRALVIGFEEAAQTHGGAGALYIRLRRRNGGD